MSLDVYLFHLLNNLSSHWPLVGVVGVFTAEVVVWLLLAWYLVAFIWARHQDILELLVSAVGAGALYLTNSVVSLWWFRPRPFATEATFNLLVGKPLIDKSFPSEHAALAFFLAYLLVRHRRSWWWAYLVAAAVALGRVVVGVHYPLDVLAGAVIGLIFGFFTTELSRIWQLISAPTKRVPISTRRLIV
ncbi:MAG: phosphatase PAP2 family protein [Candidatus Kerfeldbacteria bacterium]|nr:phosphatase PAP2 family protein [Candidatus Kerfeldbacteria bacterium]